MSCAASCSKSYAERRDRARAAAERKWKHGTARSGRNEVDGGRPTALVDKNKLLAASLRQQASADGAAHSVSRSGMFRWKCLPCVSHRCADWDSGGDIFFFFLKIKSLKNWKITVLEFPTEKSAETEQTHGWQFHKNSYNTTEKKRTKLIFIKKDRRELNNPKFPVQPLRQDAVTSPQWPVHLPQLSTLLRAVTGTAMWVIPAITAGDMM